MERQVTIHININLGFKLILKVQNNKVFLQTVVEEFDKEKHTMVLIHGSGSISYCLVSY